MSKIDVIARRILGWKLNSWDKWYDFENNRFIENFQPEQNLDDAMLIVKTLEQFGFTYTTNGTDEVCFDNACASGQTLPQAITNAAYLIADNSTIDKEWL